ncbi:TPA: Eco57I restriction-modification methylase domain-containing protein, partial [Legionella pneumophila]|nr:Eco57I restriction-modification methylase domain-containing protein [Legionella pneumophila]
GFDIVIANPPYIDSEEMTKSQKSLRDNIAKNYQLTKGNWDIYIAFYERGFKILNTNGSLAFISPDKWIVKSFGYELRKASLKKLYSILKSGRDVFKEAKVDSIITVFINKECSDLKTYSYENRKIIFKGEISKNLIHEPFTLDFVFSNYLFILKKIESCKGFLSDSFKCENACATSDAYKLKPLIEDLIESDFDKTKHLKIINTGTIGKYTSKWGKVKMTYLKSKYLFPVVDREKFLKLFNN